jgi:hypothetical protein
MEPPVDTPLRPITVGFHAGNVVHYLSQAYGDGFLVLRELVQNPLDEGAKNIYVRIDCNRRLVCVYDDGNGAGEAEIREKFENIGLSLKLSDPGAIGHKGIGNLAGIAVAEQWELFARDTSVRGDPYRLYAFNRSELKKSDELQVHCEVLSIKSITGAPFQARTMVRLVDMDEMTLKQLGDHALIQRTLTEAFASKLKSHNVNLRVAYKDFKGKLHDFNVKPPQYRGTPMEPEKYDTEFGEVEFVFFHSPKPLVAPVLLVQHQGVFSIPLKTFFMYRVWGREVEEIFSRGYFEGEIRLGFCEMNPSRTGFEPGHQYKVFIQAVESFVADVLRPIVEQLDQEGRTERHRRIADSLLKRVGDYFRKHPSYLPPVLHSLVVKPGGKGITAPAVPLGGSGAGATCVLKPIVPPKLTPSAKAKAEGLSQPLPGDTFKRQRAKSQAAKAAGVKPKREPRILEIGDGLGLQIISPDANEEGFSWHSRISPNGLIQINAENDEFLTAERRGQTKLYDYMSLLLCKELSVASLNPIDARSFGNAFEKSFMNFWRAPLD